MADNEQNYFTSQTVQSTAAGNIEFKSGIEGSQVNFTHSSGANYSFADQSTSSFNPENSQSLTLRDDFSTVYGSRNSYTRGTRDNRIEGDSVEFVGPSELLSQDIMTEWFKEYANGIGAIQAQWPDNRYELKDEDYPANPIFEMPKGTKDVTVCPPLLDGTAENNKDASSMQEFEAKMIPTKGFPDPAKESDATKQLQLDLAMQYEDTAKNLKALNSAMGLGVKDVI